VISKKQHKDNKTSIEIVRELVKDQWIMITLFALISASLYYCYPFPHMVSDSQEYISSAERLANNPYHPIGYSLFLALVHFFYSSTQAIVVAQALIYLVSVLYFIYQIAEVLNLSIKVKKILGILLVLNPLPILYTHFVLSDSLFIAITLCYLGSMLRFTKEPKLRIVIEILVWSGLCLLVRHVGLLFMVFSAIVIVIKLRKRSLRQLLFFASGCIVVVLLMCYKMKIDLGVFRLNTFDGWTLWSSTAKYIDLSEEYRQKLSSEELKNLYNYFGSYPIDTYTKNAGFWNLWSNDAPAKKLMFYYIQRYNLNYYDAWIITNDNLSIVAKDILIKNLPKYFYQSYLPFISKGFWPEDYLGDTGWKDYPYYPKSTVPDQVVQRYNNQLTTLWFARFDIFPMILPYMMLWTKALLPIFLLLFILYCAIYKKTEIFVIDTIYFLFLGFIIFYLCGIGVISEIFTRFLLPNTSILIVLNFFTLLQIRSCVQQLSIMQKPVLID
jgi:hypothetical protein